MKGVEMAKVMSDQQFQELEAQQRAARDFAGRMGLKMEDRERLSGLSDDELRVRADELAAERDAARACREFVAVYQQLRRRLAALDALVANPPAPLTMVAASVSDADLPGQLVNSAVRFMSARDSEWVLAARAELTQPGPSGFDPGLGVGEYRSAETAADRERQTIKRELDARAAERSRR